MASPLEAEISSLMRTHGDASLVAEELLNRWHRNLLNEAEQIDCAQFLVAAGLYPSLFAEIQRLIEIGAKLPWAQFAEALGRAGIKPDEYEIQAIFEAAEAQEAIANLLRSRQLDLFHRSFGERREAFLQSRLSEIDERKQDLKDKLEFVRAQRMFEQEAQAIEEFQNLFPSEDEFKADKEAFQLRWAREIIANSTSSNDMTSDLAWKTEKLSDEQLHAKTMIVTRSRELAAEDPSLAYDLSVNLHLMGFSAEALEILDLAQKSPAADWLRLELLIHARQFVTVLENTAQLELQYAGNPDAVFATTYARARALHGLGQELMAIELLRSLVRIRPNYRSAQSLLMDWSGGDE